MPSRGKFLRNRDHGFCNLEFRMTRHRSDPGTGSAPPSFPGTFLLAFREAVAAVNWKVERWLGRSVECLDVVGRKRAVGLDNLYRRARQIPREEWPALIVDFLKTIQTVDPDEALPKDLATVAEQLLVRLGQPLQRGDDAPKVWSRPLGDTKLFVNLVIDFPNRMSYVTEELIGNSDRPADEWLERGLENLRQRTPSDWFQVGDEESGILVAKVADAYDSSRALILDRLLPDSSPFGCCVALPGRDELILLPITRKSFPFVHLLKAWADKRFEQAPYAISDQVFWIYQGSWHLFPIAIRELQATVEPPEEFLPILQQLNPEKLEPPTGA
jgi:hypothetical protein